MSNLDKLVSITINLQATVADGVSFSNMLILGAAPASGSPQDIAAYGSLAEVQDAGWKVTGEEAEPVGIAARIAFANGAKLVYIGVVKAEETAVQAVTRSLDTEGWYVVAPAGVGPDEMEDLAEYIETTEKLLVYGYSQTDPVSQTELYRTAAVCCDHVYGTAVEAGSGDGYKHIALCAKALQYTPGSETWAFKPVSSVTASQFTTAQMKTLEDAHTNYIASVGGRTITMNGQVKAGEWIDLIRFRDWLKNEMQVEVATLFLKRPKIPYTDSGIALIDKVMRTVLKRGQQNGGIAEDAYDSDENLIPGFTTSVPLAADISDSVKASRKLTGCTFSATIAGAIHMVEINGDMVYSR